MENYKENLESTKEWYKIAKEQNNQLAIEILEKHFPELVESEDERIRKLLIDIVKVNSCGRTLKDIDNSEYKNCITTLKIYDRWEN